MAGNNDTSWGTSLDALISLAKIIGGVLALIRLFKDTIPQLRAYLAVESKERTGRRYLTGAGLAVICAIMWGASFASLGHLSNESTLRLTSSMFGFAAIFLLLGGIALSMKNGTLRSISTDWIRGWKSAHAPLLVVFNLGNFYLSILALHHTSASKAMALINLSPVLLAIWLYLIKRIELSFGSVSSVLLVGIGALLVNSADGATVGTNEDWFGLAIALLAAASFASWSYYIEEVDDLLINNANRMLFLSSIFLASFIISVVVDVTSGTTAPLSEKTWMIVAANGLRVAVVYYLFQLSITYGGSLVANAVVVLQVPLTFPFDYYWNNADVTLSLVLGTTLIVIAAVSLVIDKLTPKSIEEPRLGLE